MKLIRVGSSPACDLQLASTYVSSSHAEITLLDGGEIIIEDLGSTNGTYVGEKRIKPNQEVTVRRGDRVRFADTDLNWSRVPSLPSNSSYKQIINIGTNYRNDLQVNSGAVSRFHATLKIDKNGNAFIVDNGSRNGTKVNGIKSAKDHPTPIKRGDIILLGNEDITENIQQYLPKKSNILPVILGAVGAVAALVGLILLVPMLITSGPDKESIPLVRAEYHFEITLSDTPIELVDILKFRYPESGSISYEGTAFFIDEKGHLGTNRHITHPWDYRHDDLSDNIKKNVESTLAEIFPMEVSTSDDVTKLRSTILGNAICNYISQNYPASQVLSQLNAMIARIRKSSLEIKGIHDDLRVGYAGRMYSNFSEFEPCTVIADSKDNEIDVAIIQLNTRKTPDFVGEYLNIMDAFEGKLEPMKDDLITIGYPSGHLRGFATTITLQPAAYDTKCNKVPGKINFECQTASEGGASGSPLYIKGTKTLVGILSGGWIKPTGEAANCTRYVQARYLKDLYIRERLHIE